MRLHEGCCAPFRSLPSSESQRQGLRPALCSIHCDLYSKLERMRTGEVRENVARKEAADMTVPRARRCFLGTHSCTACVYSVHKHGHMRVGVCMAFTVRDPFPLPSLLLPSPPLPPAGGSPVEAGGRSQGSAGQCRAGSAQEGEDPGAQGNAQAADAAVSAKKPCV